MEAAEQALAGQDVAERFQNQIDVWTTASYDTQYLWIWAFAMWIVESLSLGEKCRITILEDVAPSLILLQELRLL